jgi:ADP-ribosylglycohydrolase
MDRDKFAGCLWGCALGDAIGMPYEFVYGMTPYEDKIVSFGPLHGEISDDCEMMIVLATSLAQNKGLDEKKLAVDYCKWASSNLGDIGINTSKLFEDKRSYEEYLASYKEIFHPKKIDTWTQSNGCLMRAMPLVAYPDPEMWRRECSLTNPHPVTVDAHFVYLMMLRCLVQGKSRQLDLSWAKEPQVKAVIRDVLFDGKNFSRDISEKRGWVLHALYCACWTYNNLGSLIEETDPFVALFREIIGKHLNSDTDTNACIAGAVLGAACGLQKMKNFSITRENLNAIVAASKRTNRPHAYRAERMFELTQQ